MSDALSVHDPIVMGIVNVTPDSFSDGGKFSCIDKAVEHGIDLLNQGASILDIGGESTRPGSDPVEIDVEISRVVPVVEALCQYIRDAKINDKVADSAFLPCISVDTRHVEVMEAALKAGASFINDITALSSEDGVRGARMIAEAGAKLCLMHMLGSPKTMQKNPFYNNVLDDVFNYLNERVKFCETHGVAHENIVIDPGIGFGKTLEHNLILLRNIRKLCDIGCPVLLGTSRKSFIGALSQNDPASERIGGSLSSVLWGYSQGVEIFRVHDVRETVQALRVHKAITGAIQEV